MALRQTHILLRRISQNPFYSSYKNSILHYSACANTDDEHNQDIHALFSQAYQIAYDRTLPANSYFSSTTYSDNFFDLFGAFPHEKTFLFADDTDYLPIGDKGYSSGYYSIVSTVMAGLLNSEIRTWSDFNQFYFEPHDFGQKYDDLAGELERNPYTSYFQSTYFGREMDQRLNSGYTEFLIASSHERASEDQRQLYAEMCSRLKSRSQQELRSHSMGQQLFSSRVSGHLAPWPRALNSCIGCHDSGANNVSTHIPFRSPEQLAPFGQTFESVFGWGNLFDSTALLTLESMTPAHLGGHRMPLGQRPLSLQERAEIQSWMEQNR
jgi:hypothetical protein